MNAVYIRMLLYILAPLVALMPGIEHMPDAGTLVIDLETAAVSLPVAFAGLAGIFAKWGKK